MTRPFARGRGAGVGVGAPGEFAGVEAFMGRRRKLGRRNLGLRETLTSGSWERRRLGTRTPGSWEEGLEARPPGSRGVEGAGSLGSWALGWELGIGGAGLGGS